MMPTDHYCTPVIMWPRLPHMARCACGAWWRTETVNDVFTEGPCVIWARVGWWDFRARWAIARRRRKATR